MKKALVIGIDDYPNNQLLGCVNDASVIARLLESNGDGAPNFDVRLLTSNQTEISNEVLHTSISELFSGEAETVLLFFAGHGNIDPNTQAGYIVSQNGSRCSLGMSISEIVGLANNAYPRIKSSVIVLDCCNSGFAGEVQGAGNLNVSSIGNGVTILTACHRDGTAAEVNGHGLFTEILIDGLTGGAADICGRITPASLYSHVDQVLGSWDQRPIYKANVQRFITLREVAPKVPLAVLRELPFYFPDRTSIFNLDPSYEPDRKNVPEQFRHLPVNPVHTRIFKDLQLCNRHGLVIPVDADHMYYAAINSTGCKLTAMGAHYRKLAEMKRI